jgi:hypothetical protein
MNIFKIRTKKFWTNFEISKKTENKQSKTEKTWKPQKKPENEEKNPYVISATGPAQPIRRLSGSDSLPQ